MNADQLLAALDQAWPDDKSSGNWSGKSRRNALAEFQRLGYPSRKLEAWRYTDLRRLEGLAIAPASAVDSAPPPMDAVEALLDQLPVVENRQLIVIVDGAYAAGLSRPSDYILHQLSAETSSAVAGPQANGKPERALVALNQAFAAPIAITLASDAAAIDKDIAIAFVTTRASHSSQVRFSLHVQDAVSARVTQFFLTSGEKNAGWTNFVSDIRLAEGTSLELIRVQDLNAEHSMTSLLEPVISENASLTIGNVDLGGHLVRTDIDARLAAKGANANVFGLTLAGKNCHIDTQICADHVAPESASQQEFRSIVDGGGRAVFNSKVIVRKDAQKIDAHQRSDNLILAPDAEVDTKPELEIYADDVRCSHGATTGELDEDALFYLQSRGVPIDTAKALLTFGFARTLLSRISEDATRDFVSTKLGRLLGESIPDDPQFALK